jgi:hypothetical protein
VVDLVVLDFPSGARIKMRAVYEIDATKKDVVSVTFL